MGSDYFFDPALRCGRCGERCRTGAPTRLHPTGRGDQLGVGADVRLASDPPPDTHAPASSRGPGEPLRLLEVWECDACGAPGYALVTVEGGIIRAIEGVALDVVALDRATHVSRELGAAFHEPDVGEDALAFLYAILER